MPNPAEPMGLAHGRTWRNRIAMAPLTNCQSHADGTLSHDEIEWLTARAQGEFGLVMTAAAFVAPAGHVWEGQLGIASDDHLLELQRLAQNLRNAGACSAVQLHHGGRRAERRITGRAAQCPWDDPAHDAVAMTGAEIEATVADFVAAAVRAERAGLFGGTHRVLHLAENLRLADDHRIEPGGDAEGVADGLALRQCIDVGLDDATLDRVVLGQPLDGVLRIVCRAVDLGAVAGRKDGHLPRDAGTRQVRQRMVKPVGVERHLLAHGERSRMVVDAERKQRHARGNP